MHRYLKLSRSEPVSKSRKIKNKRENNSHVPRIAELSPGTRYRHPCFFKDLGELPDAEFHIYGDGEQRNNLTNLAAQLGLDGRVKFFREVPIHEIANIMVNSDLGIVPKRSNSFGNEAFSTKVLEFMSLGVPVLVSSTRIDQFYFNDDVVHFFKAQDEDDLADKLLFLLKNESFRKTLSARALAFAVDFSWDLKKMKYLDLVDSLTVPIE